MALDPQCKAFLDRVKSFNIPDLPVQGVHFARSNGHGERRKMRIQVVQAVPDKTARELKVGADAC